MIDRSQSEFHLYVAEINDSEALAILRERRRSKAYDERMHNRLPDPRPMCSEESGDWKCRMHAGYKYKDKPVCKNHLRMYQRMESRKKDLVKEAFAQRVNAMRLIEGARRHLASVAPQYFMDDLQILWDAKDRVNRAYESMINCQHGDKNS
jgi:hypothetical protein